MNQPHVAFGLPDRVHYFKVEIADTPQKRAMGLMGREHLPLDWGMLFVFEEPSDHSFWMRNTLIPLDLIFISDKGKVLGTIEETTPFDDTPRSLGIPSSYVLEVNSGRCRKLGITAGTRASINI